MSAKSGSLHIKRRECAMKFYICLVYLFSVSSILLGLLLPKVVGRKKNGRLAVGTRFNDGCCVILVFAITAGILLAIVLYDMRQWDRFRTPTMMAYGWQVAIIYAIWVLLRFAVFLAAYFAVVTTVSEWMESILNSLYQNGYFTFWRNRKGRLVFGPTIIKKWIRRRRRK